MRGQTTPLPAASWFDLVPLTDDPREVSLQRFGRMATSSAPVFLPVLIAIAACVGSLELGSSEQETIVPLQDYNFGNVQVGVTSSPNTFTISPASGVQSNQITSVSESCPDFAITATGLPATVNNVCTGGSGCTGYIATTYSFTGTFTPAVAAQVSCVVTVGIDGVPTTFTLTGRGTEPAIRMTVSPSSTLDLGQVRIGDTSAAASVLVRNVGSGPQPMTVSSVAFDAASITKGFAVASGTTTSHVVAANGGSDPYTVTCRPTATGAATGTLTITTDDPAMTTTTITVSCTGITSNLVFLPAAPALLQGAQAQRATRVGEPIDVPITLRNSGTATMTINSLSLAGAQLELVSGPNTGTVLAVNGTTNVMVRFAASSPVDQGTLGTLTINHDTNQVRTLNVLGAALATTMSVSPDGAVNLGPICIGNTGSQSFFVLKNNPGTFKITSVTAPAAPFVLTGMLPTNGALDVDTNAVSFTASVTPTEASVLTSELAVVTDIPNEPPRTISLSAIGLPEGVTPTPASVDLGTVSVGATSTGQMVTLTNCGATALTLNETLIVGANQDDFEIAIPPTSTTVEPGASAVYVIVARPNNAGGLSATLQIRYAGGMAEVPLFGNGTGDDPNRLIEPSTYYSCSTGTGHSAWPLGAAFLLLLRRRKRAA